MWLQRRRPRMWRPSFYTDSCVYDTVFGSECSFGPMYLRSVISESLKRLGRFGEDKWWTGRTADVVTQTLQDDGVDWGQTTCPTTHTVVGSSSAKQQLQMAGIIHSPLTEVSPSTWATLFPLIKTNDKEWLLDFHNVFGIKKLVNRIAQNKWAE